MAEPIGPGDLVECIDASVRGGSNTDDWAPSERPIVGAIYTVTALASAYDGLPCLVLAELRRTPRAIMFWGVDGYAADRFRPISRRSDFEAFLTQIKAPRDDVREKEPA